MGDLSGTDGYGGRGNEGVRSGEDAEDFEATEYAYFGNTLRNIAISPSSFSEPVLASESYMSTSR